MKENDTYEIWYLGDFWKQGPLHPQTYNEFLIDAYDLMACGHKAGLTVGGVEIFRCSGNDVETVFDFNFANGYDPNEWRLRALPLSRN